MRLFCACFALAMAVLGPAGPRLWADGRADYLAALEHQKAGRWDEAAQGYARVGAQLPNYAPAWKQLAAARFHLGDLEGAVASADRYLGLQPDDQAFADWSDQLRAKLGLPPRVQPSPTPGPPTPEPTPAPTSLLMEAPPPSVDAEIVAVEASGAINSAASTDIQALEAQEARRSAEQMAEEAAAILRRRPPGGGVAWGLRLMGGLALGLGRFEHGEDVDSDSAPGARRYNGAPAGGGSGLAELTVGFAGTLDLGLGVHPLLWNDARVSSRSGALTRKNSSEAGAAFLPLMLSLTWRRPLTAGFSALLAGGVGAIPSATLRIRSQTVQTSVSGLSVASLDTRLDYGLAPAWRVMLGGEWSLGPRSAFVLGAQMLGASFADAGGSSDLSIRDENGVETFAARGLPAPAQALQLQSLNLLAGMGFSF